MSVITFTKAAVLMGSWSGCWVACSNRLVDNSLYPFHPYPSVSKYEAKKLLSYIEKNYEKYSFHCQQKELDSYNKKIYDDRIIWGIRFLDEADEAAFMLHMSNGIEII